MASLTVYPAVGRTVYAADLVTVITSAGAVIDPLPEASGVPYVPEHYQRLLSKGLLLTYNPLGDSGGPPVTLPGGSSGGGSSAGVTHTIASFSGGDVAGSSVQAADALIFSGLAANRTINGVDWSGSGASVKSVYNADATYSLVVANNGTTSVKQVQTSTGAAVTVGPGKAAFIAYDAASGKYRLPSVDADAARRADALGGLLTTDLDTFVPGSAGVTVRTIAYSDATTDYGYDQPGDGGGAEWRWFAGSTTTANGYNVRGSTAAGRWKMRPQSVYRITQFGGKPGTSVDNGAILAGAWESLRTASDGEAWVHFPRSALPYHCTTRPVVPTASALRRTYGVSGDGWVCQSRDLFGYPLMADANVKPVGSVITFAANISGPGWGDGLYSNFAAKDIALVGDHTSTTLTRGFQQGAGQSAFHNVLFAQWWIGADLGQSVSSRRNSGMVFRGCWQGLIGGEAENAFRELDAQGCNYGFVIKSGYDVIVNKGLLQGNPCHVLIGEAAADQGRSITLRDIHYESADAPQFFVAVVAIETATNRALTGFQTVDGVAGGDGVLVALGAQSAALENGLWRQRSGAWERVAIAGANYLNQAWRGMYVRVTGGANIGLWKIEDITGPGFATRDALSFTKLDTNPSAYPQMVRPHPSLTPGGYFYNLVMCDSDSSEPSTIVVPASPSSMRLDGLFGGDIVVDCPASAGPTVVDGVTFSRSSFRFVVRDGANIRGEYFDGREVRQHRRSEILSTATTFTPDVNLGSHYVGRSVDAALAIQAPQGFGDHSVVSLAFKIGSTAGSIDFSAFTVIGDHPKKAPVGSVRHVQLWKVQTGLWQCTHDSGWRYPASPRDYEIVGAGGTMSLITHFWRYDSPLLIWNSGSSGTLTIPSNASVFLPVGQTQRIYLNGAGQLTIAGAAGVTLRAPKGDKSAFQYGEIRLRQVTPDVWHVDGDLTP